MFEKNTISYVDGIMVVVESLDNYKGHPLELDVVQGSANVSGCCALRIFEEQMEPTKAAMRTLGIPFVSSIADALESNVMISMTYEFFLDHTDEEKRAILYHELGHVKAGHLFTTDTGGILDTEAFEIEADAFAIAATSKASVRNALVKCIDASIKIMAKYKNYSEERVETLKAKVEDRLATSERFKLLQD